MELKSAARDGLRLRKRVSHPEEHSQPSHRPWRSRRPPRRPRRRPGCRRKSSQGRRATRLPEPTRRSRTWPPGPDPDRRAGRTPGQSEDKLGESRDRVTQSFGERDVIPQRPPGPPSVWSPLRPCQTRGSGPQNRPPSGQTVLQILPALQHTLVDKRRIETRLPLIM